MTRVFLLDLKTNEALPVPGRHISVVTVSKAHLRAHTQLWGVESIWKHPEVRAVQRPRCAAGSVLDHLRHQQSL